MTSSHLILLPAHVKYIYVMANDRELDRRHRESMRRITKALAAIRRQAPLLDELRSSGLATVIEQEAGNKKIPELIMITDGGSMGPWPFLTGLHGTEGFLEGGWGFWILPRIKDDGKYDETFSVEAAIMTDKREEENTTKIDANRVLIELNLNHEVSVRGASEEFKGKLGSTEARVAVRKAFANPEFVPSFRVIEKRQPTT